MNKHIERFRVGLIIVGLTAAVAVLAISLIGVIILVMANPTHPLTWFIVIVLVVAIIYGIGVMADA